MRKSIDTRDDHFDCNKVGQELNSLFCSIFRTKSIQMSNIYDFRKHPRWRSFCEKAHAKHVAWIYICKTKKTEIGWLPVYECKKHTETRVFLPEGSVIVSLVNVINELYKDNH